jgi:hypothetical protein
VLNHNGSFAYPQRQSPLMMMPPSPYGGVRGPDNVFLSPNFAGGNQPLSFGGGGGLGGRSGSFYDQRQIAAAAANFRRPIVLQPHTVPYQHLQQSSSYTPG